MPFLLRLYHDNLAGEAGEVRLPAAARMLYVVHGSLTIEGRTFGDGKAWHGEGAVTLAPGKQGVACWRFEFVSASAGDGGDIATLPLLSAALDTLPPGELLLRGDSVAFPPGGCAFLHRHQGPGIRCLIEGGIRIDTHGRSTSYGPGDAWFETGPDAVFAQAAADRTTRFIRMMVLPRELMGKSSIQYVNDEDKARPKSQSYEIFIDAPIARPVGT
jgi:hypothetical protein